MGLSLCYELRLRGNAAAARSCMERLHDFALGQSFKRVLDLVELRPPDIAVEDQDELSGEYERLLNIFGSQYAQRKLRNGEDAWIDIPPQHVIAFGIDLAKGSEYAQLGLASHPAVIERELEGETVILETDFAGVYSWSQCCKTQFAGSQQYGGFDNFLVAHLGLVRCLDYLETLGVEVKVRDDSEFWEHRDEQKLRATLAEWQELIAAFTGQMKDQLEKEAPDVKLTSPILEAPDFEHLEAKGFDAWTSKSQSADDDESPDDAAADDGATKP